MYADYRCALLGALITLARARKTASYTDVVALARLPLDLKRNPVHRNLMSAWLFEIAKEEDAAGRPLLPAIVVRSGSGLPGAGYFAMLHALGRDFDGQSENDVHGREVQAVFNFYGDRRAVVECWVEPARDRDRGVIESSRSPQFFLQPIRYPNATPEFQLIHSGALTNGRAGEYVTPEWFTGTWALLPSIWGYRFLLKGDPMFWMLSTWQQDESGRRVQIVLKPEDARVVDVRKMRDYPDGSMAFEVLHSDGVKTRGKVRRAQGDVLNFFEDYHRPGWPEAPIEMVRSAFNDVIPD